MFGALLEVEMLKLKKCTRLWREAHFEVKMRNTHTIARALLEVYTSLWREADVEVNMSKNTAGSERFWR